MSSAAQFLRLLMACATLAFGNARAQLPPPPASPAPVAKLEYDAQGNPTRTVLAPSVPSLNLSTASSYDRLNRRKDTTDARTKTTLFEYNGREDLTQVTDPRSLITRYLRNGLGDALELISPDTGTAQNTHDAAGNLKTRLDNRSVLATYAYDPLNRLSSLVYSKPGEASMSVIWGYDQTGAGFSHGIGRLTSTQFTGGSATYSYDPQGRLLSTTQSVTSGSNTAPLTTGYGYDAAGRITSITYPSGRVLHITHSGGMPTALSLAPDPNSGSAALPLVSNLQFEPSPGGYGVTRSWLWQLSSGTQSNERVFDLYGRMVRYPLGGAVRDIIYDAADRISNYIHYNATSGAQVASLDQSFGYDQLSRLTSVSTSLGSWTFAYDDNGNRTLVSTTAGGASSSRTYTVAANSNRLLALDNPQRTLTQDAAGNTYSDVQDRVGWTATYDLAGRLVNLSSSPDGSSAYVTQYIYNAFGQRVLVSPVSASCIGPQRTCAAIATRRAPIVYIYDQQGMLLGEYSGDGTPLREYVWLHGMPLAVIDGAPATPFVYYVQTDHLDTPRTVIDRAGRQRWTWLAEPFGNSAPINNPLGFGAFNLNLRMAGQYWDRESALVYNWHRTYDAGIGRYTQSDPIGLAGGINTYLYANGSPTMFTDPDGKFAIPLIYWAPPVISGAYWWLTRPPAPMERTQPRWWPSMPEGDAEFCRQERRRCAELCEEAECKPDFQNVWGGSIDRCIRGCLPEKCGGNKTGR